MQTHPTLILEQLEIGPMGNYAYFIGDAKTNRIAIVDPGWDIEYLINTAANMDYEIIAVILTHGHYDHAQGLEELLRNKDMPVYVSRQDAEFFSIKTSQLHTLEDNQTFKIDSIEMKSILSPGHTPGCMCFYHRYADDSGGILLTGDVLFIGACGRCDLPGSDPAAMYDTLYNKLMKLPDDTLIFSGHGYGRRAYDTLGHQKETNPYLKFKSKEDFFE